MTTTHFLLEDTFIGRNFINFSDVHARVKCHIITGILLSVLMMLHMWTIFLPPIFSKYSIEVKPGGFGWPISERTPSGFKAELSPLVGWEMRGIFYLFLRVCFRKKCEKSGLIGHAHAWVHFFYKKQKWKTGGRHLTIFWHKHELFVLGIRISIVLVFLKKKSRKLLIDRSALFMLSFLLFKIINMDFV